MQSEICARIAGTLASAPIHDHLGYEALAHLKLPGPDYRHLLGFLHKMLKPKLYVEIGVRDGGSLALAAPETRCIGVDPAAIPVSRNSNTVLACTTSDNFFAHQTSRERARDFDLAFIDGDHTFDQALRDFLNLKHLAKPSSIVCIHDVIPMDERTATPQCETSFWTGDVWRLMAAIVTDLPDLIAFTVACPPTGLGIVGRFPGMDRGSASALICTGAAMRFPSDWDSAVAMLNIIPNDGRAIGQALLGAKAA